MRLKKNTLTAILSLSAIIVLVIAGLRISNDAKISKIISEHNTFCGNLSLELSQQEGIDKCFCYYEGFKTGQEEVDSKTLPLCACDCMINGTTQKIGILETRA